jgi:outer membrane protein TolC
LPEVIPPRADLNLPQALARKTDAALPINLPTALRLADARPIIIAAAQASLRAAAAEFDRARVLWLPNLNAGVSYYRHDGAVQGSSGQFFVNGRNQFLAGGGPYAIIQTADAFFAPLAARQVVRSRRFEVQRARNDALLAVAEAYFNVQQARGRLAGFEDAVEKAERLVRTVDALAAGLVSPIETNRARTLLAALRQSAATAQGEWGVASAELTRALRLDPGALVLPIEPPQLRIALLDASRSLDDLIAVGLTSRPELASQQALVRAALERLRQERLRPLMPSVLLLGDAVPTAPGGYLMGGIFASSTNGQGAPLVGRNDVSVQMLWGLNNLGLGNQALVRQRRAEEQQTLIELFRIQDAVAAEIATAHAQLQAAGRRVTEAETGIRQAQVSYAGNVKGLGETTRFGDLLILVNRPQEVVAALQQLATAYDNYFVAVNDYNRSEFRLYRAVGYPAGILAYERSLGPVQPVDMRRPTKMAPVGAAGVSACP